MIDKDLRNRWRTEAGQGLAEEVVARLISGRPLHDLGLATHEDRFDLRGLPTPLPRRLKRFESQGWFVEQLADLIEFRGVRLERLDLGGAQLQSFRFYSSEISNCRLVGANCRDWRLWDSRVSDSSFATSNLREAAVGTWHDGRYNKWQRVDFSGSDFRVGVNRSALYEDCEFSGANLANVEFSQCALSRCRFGGDMAHVTFDGRDLKSRPAPPPMSDVDFSGAFFDQVEFLGFDLERVTLPNDPDIRLISRYKCVVEHGLRALQDNESSSARILRAQFQNRMRMMRSDQDAKVFNRRDYVNFGGDELAGLADRVLSQAQAECESL